MRNIPPELQARLDGGTTTLCRCWKIARQDGRIFGFTDHDVDLEFDGVLFEAGSGLDAAALQSSTGLSVDNCQAQGALSAEMITEDDIREGKFDRASVSNWLVDWRRPDLRVLLFSGTLGEIRRSDGRFEAELRGPTEALNAPVGRSILRTCDRVLGDAKCRFDLKTDGYSFEAQIIEATDRSRIVCSGISEIAANWFAHGSITVLTGVNSGALRSIRGDRIRSDGSREIEFWRALPQLLQAGDRIRLTAGCDKLPETCRQKFSNFLNFRGFPHIPGEDWVAAYPRDGDIHDGSSLK